MKRVQLLHGVLPVAALMACVPTVDEDPSRAELDQILAVRFEPAEAEPKATTRVTALFVGDSDGGEAAVAFDLCLARKALSELGPVAPECIATSSTDEGAIRYLGAGRDVDFVVPDDACRLFGPQRPEAEPGQPPGRPADPDPTGGYYQPVIARLGNTALGGLRLDCGLPGASQEQVAEYNRNYEPNTNPMLERIALRIGNGSWRDAAEDDVLSVPQGAMVSVRTEWSTPETYQFLSTEERVLERREETYLASFYSSVGGFVNHRVTVDERSRADAEWRSPSTAGVVRIWAIVRDGRGGVGWVSFGLNVE